MWDHTYTGIKMLHPVWGNSGEYAARFSSVSLTLMLLSFVRATTWNQLLREQRKTVNSRGSRWATQASDLTAGLICTSSSGTSCGVFGRAQIGRIQKFTDTTGNRTSCSTVSAGDAALRLKRKVKCREKKNASFSKQAKQDKWRETKLHNKMNQDVTQATQQDVWVWMFWLTLLNGLYWYKKNWSIQLIRHKN